MNFEEILRDLKAWLTSDKFLNSLFKIGLSIAILIFSFKIINLIAKAIENRGEKKHADKTIVKTLAYLFRLGTKILIVIAIIGFLGIDTSGMTALIASMGVCIGLAVNGAISNLAGGVLIILTRPFRVDDYIEAQGYAGTVAEIHVTYTKLVTPDRKTVYIPNGALSSGNIVNYSEQDVRRIDFSVPVGYGEDYEKVKRILTEICNNHSLILKEPSPMIVIKEYAPSSLTVQARTWVKSTDYWTVYFDLTEKIKSTFDEQKIVIPFNQLDVHVKTS